MDETLVVASGIGRDFPDGTAGRTTVLRDVDCAINSGARIALVGPSGSGKTTLLHILGGLDRPTNGQIEWPGLGPFEDLRPRWIGFVFQSPSLFPALTAAQNISLPMILAGELSSADRTAALLLDTFGLDELADKLPEELSGGQAQRIAMARALAIGPKLILADEPTGQLDSVTAQLFFDTVLSHLENTGIALVVATHDEAVAARMATRWTMEHGRLTLQSLQTGAS
ncbi:MULTISPECIES: ABC transporter ATP-binding protein [Phyllobacteriaceae]|jgi:ABC-type lipoprotein export system ATPase subunit|uniref:ABC transporter ATP-binding protein n=1 Tax=Mesorhizobium hungaricum TaxID=1566387 RepID=A0A1C2DYT4_9HYPH|nr:MULTISPECIES: ABC transporter ATP-binding protein [Mesorhizobium]MBN9234659.1 ABC transporter ATP-binding protein [Mesorhizobium sp.]MDQ0328861.1 putative ABC transport system ATP-binding protein/lipoprotein-releasing system ATP-binding protein [Mesorhizobium sp. YL-MeA3-2017]OCX19908.1 ABC transporter ATP-binding protein [Mesorhizobium hungaricum]